MHGEGRDGGCDDSDGFDGTGDDGIRSSDGDEAMRAALGAVRDAARDGAPDPLDGLVERIRAESRPSLAFDDLVIGAAWELSVNDGVAFDDLKRTLKGAGVGITDWHDRVKRHGRARREAAKAAERERRVKEYAEAQERRALERAAEQERLEAQRAAVGAEFAPHFASAYLNSVTFTMEPGRVTTTRPKGNDDTESRDLANFSAPIVATISDFDSPDAIPRRVLVVSAIVGNDAPCRVEVSAKEFERMEWVVPLLGVRASVAGKAERDELRVGLQLMSTPVEQRRNRFTGWVKYSGQWVYAHAGGTLGADGEVEGMMSAPPSPADAFRLPAPPEGDELARVARAVVDLLSIEPADVVVPLVALGFRAALGPSRCTVHIAGEPGLGKSLLAGLVQSLYGASMDADRLPCSWTDGSSAVGLQKSLARIGDAVATVDDLKISGSARDIQVMDRADQVIRAHFNRAAPRKLNQDRSERAADLTRCSIISTGELLPRGHSLRSRVVAVVLRQRPAPDLTDLMRRAGEGELAAAMAAFIRWLAPKVDKLRPRLQQRERAAASAWNIGVTDRAAALFGALALGLDALFAWLEHVGALDGEGVAHHRERARAALQQVAIDHGEHIAEEDPVPTFLEHLRSMLTAGRCHLTTFHNTAPPSAQLFGWRPSPMSGSQPLPGTEPSAPQIQPGGARVGYVDVREGMVYLDGNTVHSEVTRYARSNGEPLNIGRKELGARLHKRGLLTETDIDTKMKAYTHRKTVDGRNITGLLWLKLATIFEQGDAAPRPTPPTDTDMPTADPPLAGSDGGDAGLPDVEFPF